MRELSFNNNEWYFLHNCTHKYLEQLERNLKSIINCCQGQSLNITYIQNKKRQILKKQTFASIFRNKDFQFKDPNF